MYLTKLLFLILFCLTLLNAKNPILSDEEKTYLKNNQPIKLHNEKNWPPYNFYEEGKPKGFSIDYMRLLAEKVGMDIEFISGYTWNEYMQMLQENKIDSIINISKNKERSEIFNFTDIFHTAANAIYVQNGNEQINTLEALRGKTIVMPKGFFAQKLIAKHYPDINQILVKDSLECLKVLTLGQADATIGKKNVLDYIISTKNISGVKAVNYVDDSRLVSLIRMATNKDNIHLRNILQKGQKAISDEELLSLKRKWFGSSSISEQEKQKLDFLSYSQQKFLEKNNEINICSFKNIQPIEFKENGKHYGVTIDLLRVIEQKLNVQLNFIDSKNIENTKILVSQNKCDIVPTYYKGIEFIDIANLSKPMFKQSLAIVTRKGEPIVKNLSELASQTIAIDKNSTILKMINSNYPYMKVIQTNNNYESLEAVNSGKAYFALEPLPIALHYMSKHALNDIYVSRYSTLNFSSILAVNDNKKELLDIINTTIDHITENEIVAVINKWTNVSIKEPFDKDLVIKITLVLIIIFLALIYRQAILHKHNKKLTEANELIEKKNLEIDTLNKNLETKVKEEIEKNKEKTSQLIHQSRLAQMGEMLSMIAHQWRQPLTAITATSNNLILRNMIDKVESKELDKELNLITNYTQHLSSTINDFKNFFKVDKERSTNTLEELTEKSLDIINNAIDSNEIEIIKSYSCGKNITLYSNEIQQVILNILKNAEDVLVERNIKSKKIYISTYCDEKYATLTINDNSGGIKEDIIDKIFDPYFSTKKNQEGTGLGLYMSKTIINEHCNGKLYVNNNELGAIFTIKLNIDTAQ